MCRLLVFERECPQGVAEKEAQGQKAQRTDHERCEPLTWGKAWRKHCK